MSERTEFECRSPIDDSVYARRFQATGDEIAQALELARETAAAWRHTALADRQALITAAVDFFAAHTEAIATEITWQMGRPISQSPGELMGFEERARHMISLAEAALSPIVPEPLPGFKRHIDRVPKGTVFVIAPWNYPLLTAVNAIVPALLAGNTVLLKHSSQTPLCAERFAEAFDRAGLPRGVFQAIHLSHTDTTRVIRSGCVDHVAFTGSVPGGRSVAEASARHFVTTGLELGGKDPAYVCQDADLEASVTGIVDGAFFNSGQSCCGIERVYVHASRMDAFAEAAAEATRDYVLGDPTQAATTLGPMVRTAAADFVRQQCAEAVAAGARPLVAAAEFAADRPGTPYLAPQILIDVQPEMRVMHEETFGPLIGILSVESDERAVELMNDSEFGLTSSVWTRDAERARRIGEHLETGTVFMNRCDYLDPALAWTGVKHSGHGCTLSALGFDAFTRPKSYHSKLN